MPRPRLASSVDFHFVRCANGENQPLPSPDEAQRLREIEERRRQKFCEFAANWEQRNELFAFIADIEARKSEQTEIYIAGKPLGDWITWAKTRTVSLDQFREFGARV
jgi:hypothetical protein